MDREEILRVLRAFNDAGLGEFATFETVAREVKRVSGTRVAVATPAALYRMKRGTVRAKIARMRPDASSDSAQSRT
jgi:hypothetical protein